MGIGAHALYQFNFTKKKKSFLNLNAVHYVIIHIGCQRLWRTVLFHLRYLNAASEKRTNWHPFSIQSTQIHCWCYYNIKILSKDFHDHKLDKLFLTTMLSIDVNASIKCNHFNLQSSYIKHYKLQFAIVAGHCNWIICIWSNQLKDLTNDSKLVQILGIVHETYSFCSRFLGSRVLVFFFLSSSLLLLCSM